MMISSGASSLSTLNLLAQTSVAFSCSININTQSKVSSVIRSKNNTFDVDKVNLGNYQFLPMITAPSLAQR